MDAGPAFGLIGSGEAAARLLARAGALGREVAHGDGGALPALVARLAHPRAVVVETAAGAEVDAAIERLYVHLEPGDIVVDASASYWGDTLRRYRRMRHRSLFYVDLVVAGDKGGLRLVVGGEDRGIARLEPALAPLGRGGRLQRAGEAGAAHFALLVEQGLTAAVAALGQEAGRLLARYPAAPLGGEVEAPPAGRLAWLVDDLEGLGTRTPLLAAALSGAGAGAGGDGRVGGFVAPGEEEA
jgi:3-hydroxyisobutyrate dehydrogenase-like beta-hydroxyacid dehydrogenase